VGVGLSTYTERVAALIACDRFFVLGFEPPSLAFFFWAWEPIWVILQEGSLSKVYPFFPHTQEIATFQNIFDFFVIPSTRATVDQTCNLHSTRILFDFVLDVPSAALERRKKKKEINFFLRKEKTKKKGDFAKFLPYLFTNTVFALL
jgi:hypothetical protein